MRKQGRAERSAVATDAVQREVLELGALGPSSGRPAMRDLGQSMGDSTRQRPTAIDRGFQTGYKLAYRMMRMYWALRRPSTHGALVMLWNAGQVLLVQNSYVRYRSLPGGYVRRNERALDAAVRELKEEIGISARPDQLASVFDEVKDWEGKRDHVEIFALNLEHRPKVEIDHREVVAADWFSPERALELDLFPPIRRVLEGVLARGGA